MRIVLLGGVILACSVQLAHGNTNLTIAVKDSRNKALDKMSVRLERIDTVGDGVTTNKNGLATFENLPAGRYEVRITNPTDGFEKTLEVPLAAGGSPNQERTVLLMPAVPGWFSYSQTILCTFVGCLMFLIYRRGSPPRANTSVTESKDRCFLYLALASWLWAVASIFPLFQAGELTKEVDVARTLVSLVNSGALILSIMYMDYAPQRLKDFRREKIGEEVTALIAIAIVGTLLLSMRDQWKWIDFGLSVLVVCALGTWLVYSFYRRQLYLMAAAAAAAIVAQMAAQQPEVLFSAQRFLASYDHVFGNTRWFLVLNSKMMFLVCFLALAFSWMREIAGDNAALMIQQREVIEDLHRQRADLDLGASEISAHSIEVSTGVPTVPTVEVAESVAPAQLDEATIAFDTDHDEVESPSCIQNLTICFLGGRRGEKPAIQLSGSVRLQNHRCTMTDKNFLRLFELGLHREKLDREGWKRVGSMEHWILKSHSQSDETSERDKQKVELQQDSQRINDEIGRQILRIVAPKPGVRRITSDRGSITFDSAGLRTFREQLSEHNQAIYDRLLSRLGTA